MSAEMSLPLPEPDRAAFEAWCVKRWAGDRGALTIRGDGEYLNGHVKFAFEAWQAAAKAERERCAKVCDAYIDPNDGPSSAVDTRMVADDIAKFIRARGE